MIIFNVTIKLEHAIASAFIQWLKDEHIPAIINTGCFTQARIFHLMDVDDEEGITYAIQYHAKDYALYKQYIDEFANNMMEITYDRWGDRFIAFRTVMQAVN